MGDARQVIAGRPDGHRLPALGSRDFRIFLAVQAVSLIGTWMQGTALPLFAYRLTGDAGDLGVVGAAQYVPLLGLTLPAGIVVERIAKRRAVIGCQITMMLQAIVLSLLAYGDRASVMTLAALSFVLGSANAVEGVARQSMLVELVGKEALPNAVALNAAVINLARVLGPLIAIPVVTTWGEQAAFLVNAGSYGVVIAGLIVLRTPYAIPRVPRTSLRSSVGELLGYLRGARTARAILGMAAVIGFVGIPLLNLLPAFTHDAFGGTDAELATDTSVLVAAMGGGSVAAAIGLAALRKQHGRGAILWWGQLVFGLALLLFSRTDNLPLAASLVFLVGLGSIVQIALINTILQLVVPDRLRSRIVSLFVLSAYGPAALGSLVWGAIAERFDTPAACGAAALVFLAGVVVLHRAVPAVRARPITPDEGHTNHG